MIDLRKYSIGYLYQLVQNESSLYSVWDKAIRRNDFDTVKHAIDSQYQYTSDQLDRLVEDFKNEAKYEI